MTVMEALQAPALDPNLRIAKALRTLREIVLEKGLPATPEEEFKALRERGKTTTRGNLWKILLGARQVSCEEYVELVKRGPSACHGKVADDAFRTFASDRHFTASVTQEQLVRVLNALVHDCQRRSGPAGEVVYVQGMNAICGLLLTVMNELDAFAALAALAQRHCPLYMCKCLDGVQAACRLVDEALAHYDPPLAAHLHAKGLRAHIYAFPWVLSLGTSLPPLSEAARIFDYLLASGVHSIVCIAVARLRHIRDALLLSSRPMQVALYAARVRARQAVGVWGGT